MFGYVRPHIPELKVKEFYFYRSLYCGLCKRQKKINKFLNISLSYDFVFLALLRMGTSGEKPEFTKGRCLVHPFKKRLHVTISSPSVEYCARASAILVYYKLLDDINDSKGFKRFAAKMYFSRIKNILKKADLPELEEIVSCQLGSLGEIEKSGCPSVYEGAEIFGKLLAGIFAYNLTGDEQKCMYAVGLHIGRFIYIADAASDAPEDIKTGEYNPFNLAGDDTQSQKFKDDILRALGLELADAAAALNLLEISDSGILSIIENILIYGMPKTAQSVILEQKKVTDFKEPINERPI